MLQFIARLFAQPKKPTSPPPKVTDERRALDAIVDLLDEYADDFGLDGAEHLERQCEFEDRFREWICTWKEHRYIPDHCGMVAHDYCDQCHRSVMDLGVKRVDGEYVPHDWTEEEKQSRCR